MHTQPSQLLKRSKGLIAAGFCQRVYAKDVFGNAVSPSDSDAVCFCSRGSVVRAAHEVDPTLQLDALPGAISCLEEAVGGEIAVWNDRWGRTPAEALAKFDEAIAIALQTERP